MASIETIMIQQKEYEERLRNEPRRPPQTRRQSAVLRGDSDLAIATTVNRYRQSTTIAEQVFGWDWFRPDASNPLGCEAWAAHWGWFEPERQAGFQHERERMAGRGWRNAGEAAGNW